jgi:hypothetical protein
MCLTFSAFKMFILTAHGGLDHTVTYGRHTGTWKWSWCKIYRCTQYIFKTIACKMPPTRHCKRKLWNSENPDGACSWVQLMDRFSEYKWLHHWNSWLGAHTPAAGTIQCTDMTSNTMKVLHTPLLRSTRTLSSTAGNNICTNSGAGFYVNNNGEDIIGIQSQVNRPDMRKLVENLGSSKFNINKDKNFRSRWWGSSLPGLRTRDPPFSPPSTWAEIFWQTCLQSHLQTSPPPPQTSYPKFRNPRTNFKIFNK